MPLARKARAHRSSIVRLTRPIRVSTCTACRRRWANGGRWSRVIGPNAAASKDIVCSLRWCWPTGSKGQAQRFSQPVRRHDGWQLAFTGSPAMRLIMATRTDRCRLRLGWETIAARRKGKATVMRYFTTDTHFGHPLVTVLRGFTTFDPTRSRYEEVLRAQGRRVAEDWAKETTFSAGSTFRQTADTDAHDKAIVDHINTLVGPDDELWILGDIGFRTSLTHLKNCLRALNCKHLHGVIGNHDDWWLEDRPALNLSKVWSRTIRLRLRDSVRSIFRITRIGRIWHTVGPMMWRSSAARRCRLTAANCCMDIHISFRQMVHARRH